MNAKVRSYFLTISKQLFVMGKNDLITDAVIVCL